MWQKIRIFHTLLSDYDHQGFIIQYSSNKIINLLNNYSLSLPFKLCLHENLYNYELMFTNTTLVLNMMLNIIKLKEYIYKNIIIPKKNSLFKILTYANKQKISNISNKFSFNDLSSIETLIKKPTFVKSFKKNIVYIKDIQFDLTEETIYINKTINFFRIDIFFTFCNNLNLLSLPYREKICIIDDTNNYKYPNLIITKNNYKKITVKQINKSILIVIDREFFYSKKYLTNYRNFHSNPTSYYAYNNYKNYLQNVNSDYLNIFNIELFDEYKIIFNNISIDKLINHPINYTKSIKILNFDYITSKLQIDCTNFMTQYCNSKYKDIYDYNLWPYKPFYIESNINKLLQNITTIKMNKHISNIKINFELSDSKTGYCDVYKCLINDNSYYKFNCNHKFMIDNFSFFNNNYNTCFICQKPITSIKYFINEHTVLQDLISPEFENLFSKSYNYYFINCCNREKLEFLMKLYNNIFYLSNKNFENITFKHNPILCISENLCYLEIISLLKKHNNVQIFKIIKLSQSI
tara:strand:+ start:582 stop:2147 length:1566 start_codon:yes stop_codon:yes gene_type:complete